MHPLIGVRVGSPDVCIDSRGRATGNPKRMLNSNAFPAQHVFHILPEEVLNRFPIILIYL